MSRKHPVRRFCRFILSSERSEARERARVASLRKGTGASLRGDSGSVFAKPPFDWLILFTIVASTIVLAIDSPLFILNNPRSSALFQVANLVFTIIFIAEFVLRAIADGLWFTPKAYFRQPWNVFDFVLLVAQCIDVFYFAGSQSSQVSPHMHIEAPWRGRVTHSTHIHIPTPTPTCTHGKAAPGLTPFLCVCVCICFGGGYFRVLAASSARCVRCGLCASSTNSTA